VVYIASTLCAGCLVCGASVQDGLAPLDTLVLVRASEELKRVRLVNLLVAAGALRLQPEAFAWRHDMRSEQARTDSSDLPDLVLAEHRHQAMAGFQGAQSCAGGAHDCAMVATSAVLSASSASLVAEEVAALLAVCRRDGPRAAARAAAEKLCLGHPEELWACGKINGSPTRWMVLAFRIASMQ